MRAGQQRAGEWESERASQRDSERAREEEMLAGPEFLHVIVSTPFVGTCKEFEMSTKEIELQDTFQKMIGFVQFIEGSFQNI